MKKEKSAMAVVFLDNQILVTEELVYGNIKVSLPKGHIEIGENTIDCAIRECFEETNCKLKKEEVIKVLDPFVVNFVDHYNEEVEKIIYPIMFKINCLPPLKIKEERIKKVYFTNIDNFIEIASYENIKDIVKVAKSFI